jgi:hypothetical protein
VTTRGGKTGGPGPATGPSRRGSHALGVAIRLAQTIRNHPQRRSGYRPGRSEACRNVQFFHFSSCAIFSHEIEERMISASRTQAASEPYNPVSARAWATMRSARSAGCGGFVAPPGKRYGSCSSDTG